MSILIAVLMILAMMMSGSLAHEEDDRSHSSRVSDMFRYSQSKEHQENRGSLEQCRMTNLWKGQLGFVNVFAFLDPSSYFSYRQAIMLELLKKRLDKSGFSNIRFFIVTPPMDFTEDNSVVNDIELKIWDEIYRSMLESEYLWSAEEMLFDDLVKISEKGMVLLRDTPQLGIWEYFHASKDEVVVVDRCGKLAYQVIVPWSILYFPYVKAAILTTYKEDPCGPCDVQSILTQHPKNYENYLLRDLNPIEEEYVNVGSYTEQTLSTLESESTTIASEEFKKIEDNQTTITYFDTSESIIGSTVTSTTATDTPVVETNFNYSNIGNMEQPDVLVSTESIKKYDSINDEESFVDNTTEPVSELPVKGDKTQTYSTILNLGTTEDYKGLQDRLYPNEEINERNDSSIFINSNADTNTKGNYTDRGNEMMNLTHAEEQEPISSADQKEEIHKKEDTLPLRIILYAPHTHQEDQMLKTYTHLILKMGSLDYHGHFDSKNMVFDQEPLALGSSKTGVLKNKELGVYGPDESPGVYGETADNWRNAEDDFPNYDDETVDDADNNNNDASHRKSNILKPNHLDTADSDPQIIIDRNFEDNYQRKIIQHYNRLLSWIYYVL